MARSQQADLVILAGDTFDHNRQSARILEEVSEVMADYGLPIVSRSGGRSAGSNLRLRL